MLQVFTVAIFFLYVIQNFMTLNCNVCLSLVGHFILVIDFLHMLIGVRGA